MAQGSRPARVADQLRAELSDLLRREVKDPGVGFITLTRVSVTADLQLARAYYTVLGDAGQRNKTRRALERVTPFLRSQIAKRISLRRVPELAFHYDETIDRLNRVEELLQEIHNADNPPGPDDGHDDSTPD